MDINESVTRGEDQEFFDQELDANGEAKRSLQRAKTATMRN